MLRRLTAITPHLPAVLLLLFGAASGTLFAGARGLPVLVGHLALLFFVAAFGRPWPDPLGLGRRGGWLLAALGVTLAASWLASSVPRAGRLGLTLLPAFLLVPSAVARCWATAEERRLGLRSVSLVVAAVAGVSLFAWWRLETPGTSLPLGHHNLLAAWLLVTLPLAAVPWREGAAGRAVAVLAVTTGLASLVATRSLAAAVAVAVVAAAVALRGRRGRLALLAASLLLVLLAPQGPRLWRIARGADASVAARLAYLEAGWRGWRQRPMLGWGPGAARWTTTEHLRPIPGVHPPDEVVGDLHSLPLELAYELGASGVLLIAAALAAFLLGRPAAVDPALRRAALAGLAALAVASCAGLPLAISALPLAAAVAVGAVLAAEPPRQGAATRGATRVATRVVTVAAAAAMAALALPLDLAHLAYDRAIDAGSRPDRIRHLRRAVELDPAFPLYGARLAWLEAETAGDLRGPARRARAAAAAARGVAPLWLVAGSLGQEAAEPWSREALVRACRLSPLGAMAPFRLTLEDGPLSDQWAGRALLAEPRLLAAIAWRDREGLLGAAVAEVARLEGVDAGWRAQIAERYAAWRDLARSRPVGTRRRLVLEMDGEAPTSASLYAFRRRPWPVYMSQVALDADWVEDLALAPAASLRSTAPAVFFDQDCGLSLGGRASR